MTRFIFAALCALVVSTQVSAGPFGLFRKGNNNTNSAAAPRFPVANAFLGSAQGVANYLASVGRVGHFGGNPYAAEGVGMGSSPEQAIRNCCFYGKRTIADSGVCQASNGMWYACNRYH